MAVPHVVGVASLLWEKDVTVDAEFIRMVMNAGAKTYEDKESYGYGLVDYEYASSIYDECKVIYENSRCTTNNIEELQQDGVIEEMGYMSDVDYNAMSRWITTSGVNGTAWDTVLEGNAVNTKNKMLVVYGMALHIATDIFSHSTYNLNGERISHDVNSATGIKYAHDINYCTNRYQCAKEIVVNVLDKVTNSAAGTVADFNLSKYDAGTSLKTCFKLRRIAAYVKAVNSIYYQNHKSYFDSMAVSSLD